MRKKRRRETGRFREFLAIQIASFNELPKAQAAKARADLAEVIYRASQPKTRVRL